MIRGGEVSSSLTGIIVGVRATSAYRHSLMKANVVSLQFRRVPVAVPTRLHRQSGFGGGSCSTCLASIGIIAGGFTPPDHCPYRTVHLARPGGRGQFWDGAARWVEDRLADPTSANAAACRSGSVFAVSPQRRTAPAGSTIALVSNKCQVEWGGGPPDVVGAASPGLVTAFSVADASHSRPFLCLSTVVTGRLPW